MIAVLVLFHTCLAHGSRANDSPNTACPLDETLPISATPAMVAPTPGAVSRK
jgi:hypothetical protein